MDSSSFDQETSLSSLAKKCLNIDNAKKEETLSNLTAKYNSTRKNMNVFGCTANSRGPSFKDSGRLKLGKETFGGGFTNSTVEKPKYLSSSEDECDSGLPGLSLVALAAKHKSPIASSDSGQSRSSAQDLPDNSSDDEYSDTGFIGSLVALAAKHKGIQNTSAKSNASSFLIDNKKDTTDIQDTKSMNVTVSAPDEMPEDKSISVTSCKEDLNTKAFEKSAKEVNTRHISAGFSDDSDSDDSFTLGGLALKHARTISHSESGSTDDKSHFKPKELQRVANFHRHYSKSESDQFAVTQMDIENITNEVFRNESSTSLGSLKGSDSSKLDFKFMLGCSIPQSFKSKQMGLTSSLGSVQVSQGNLNSSFSDPDVSVKERRRDLSPSQRDSSVMVPESPTRCIEVLGGINLACAIKSSSSTILTPDDDTDPQAELMDEEIVTLLDNMAVDIEDDDTNKSTKISTVAVTDKKDDCCLDASYMLKVKSKLRTVKCSSFGKVVCKQWRSLDTPYIRQEEIKSRVVPFKFVSPSPDDVMTGFRERRLQSSLQKQNDNSENKQ